MRYAWTFALLAQLLVLACAPARGAESATEDDTARFLAGLAPSAASPLQALSRDARWRKHAVRFDSAFADFEARHLSKIRAWSSANVPNPAGAPMAYMFSGPDWLHAEAFFPEASVYLLSGTEPVGKIPALTGLPPATVMESLIRLERSLATLLSLKFFITRDMQAQLDGGKINGTLPVLYVLLARSGKSIRAARPVKIDDQGVLRPDDGKQAWWQPQGVEIEFSDAGGKHTLYYFTTNLEDRYITRGGFLKFAAQIDPGGSLLKSASYLPHKAEFSVIRDFALAHSRTIVQDDSGIPVRYFDPTTWDLHPFGKYVRPIPTFSTYYQDEMIKLFDGSPPLDFTIGYHPDPGSSNLLLAARRDVGERRASLPDAGDGLTAP